MPVVVPERAGTRSQIISVRLAQKVAALFGVRPRWQKDNRVWFCNFSALTLAEVGRGAPLPSRAWHAQERAHGGPISLGQSKRIAAGTWRIVDEALIEGVGPADAGPPPGEAVTGVDELAPATLNRFGPDRKAAAVLLGANELFESLMPVFRDVMGTIGTLDSGDPLADRTKVLIWATLVQETFRSQPALFAAAVQGRAIQRALTQAWVPLPAAGLPVARSELGSTEATDWSKMEEALAPRRINVLDQTFKEFPPATASQAGPEYMDTIIDGWCSHLLGDAPSISWLTDKGPQGRRVEVYSPLARSLAGFLATKDEILAPAHLGKDGARGAAMLPRIPSEGELRKLSPSSQDALIWTLLQTYRGLRREPGLLNSVSHGSVREEAARVANLAQAVLGSGNMLTLWARNRVGNMTYWDYLRSDPQAASEGAALVRATLLRLSDLHQSGHIADGTFLEFLISSGSCLHGHIMNQRTKNPTSETAEQLRRELLLLWKKTFTTIGFDLDAELVQATTTPKLSPLAQAVVPLLHQYAALLTMGKSEADILQGIHLLEDFLIPHVDRPDQLHVGKENLGVALRAAIVGYKELTALLQSTRRHKEVELWAKRTADATNRLLDLEPADPVLGLEVSALMSEADPGADRLLLHAHFDLLVERLQKEELVRAETPQPATSTAVKPLEHPALFQMLRGHERVDNQAWPELRLSTGLADDESALNASIVLPKRNPNAANIILLVVTPIEQFKIAMVWEEVPGDVTRLVGRISPFKLSIEDIQSVEVEVHGQKD